MRTWSLLLAMITLTAIAACTGSRETRFYLLAPAPSAAPTEAARLSVIGLHPVRLPLYLDRPQIVTRADEHMVQLAEFEHWGSPLREHLTHVLASDLASSVPADRVAVFPWRKETPVEYEVAVEVLTFDGTLGGACGLAAYWFVSSNGGKALLAQGRFANTEPAGDRYATLVAAQSRLLAALAREIAAAIRGVPR